MERYWLNLIFELFFRKSVRKISSFIKNLTRITNILREDFLHLQHYLAEFLEWDMLQKNLVEKTKILILCSITFSFWNRAVSDIMWKTVIQPDRSQMTTRRMRFACSITNAHSEHVMVIPFPCQQLLRESASLSRYTYIACFVNFTKYFTLF